MDKKGQASFALVSVIIGGIAFLIIGIIIAFTVIGSLQGSGIIPQTTYYIVNESQFSNGGLGLVFANQTGYTLNGSRQLGSGSFVIDAVWVDYNQSNGSNTAIVNPAAGYNVSLAAVNYSLNTNATSNLSSGLPLLYNFPNVSVSYHYRGDNSQNIAAKNLTSNFSSGVQNISSKIPTIILVAAIVLILSIMAILIGLWQRFKMGNGGGGNI